MKYCNLCLFQITHKGSYENIELLQNVGQTAQWYLQGAGKYASTDMRPVKTQRVFLAMSQYHKFKGLK